MSTRSELRAWQAHTAEAALFFESHGGESMSRSDRRLHDGLLARISDIADAFDAAYKKETEG